VDFAKFLLDYTERFFLKSTDVLSLCVSLIALFVSMAAIITSLSVQQNLMERINENTFLTYLPAGLLFASLIPVIIIVYNYKNKNEKVFEIEKTIFQNYDYLNVRGISGKDKILNEFQEFYKTRGKNIEDLLASLKPDPTTNPES
jgi:hypothetical protein